MTVAGLDVLVDSPGREVTLRGTIDVRTVPDLRVQLQRIIKLGRGDLVLHLGEAEVADATGLGVLVGTHQRARRADRRLVIAEASERLERLLRVTRLHLVLARLDEGRLARPLAGTPGIPPVLPPR